MADDARGNWRCLEGRLEYLRRVGALNLPESAAAQASDVASGPSECEPTAAVEDAQGNLRE